MGTTLQKVLGGIRYRRLAFLILFIFAMTASFVGALFPVRPASAENAASYAQFHNYPPNEFYNFDTIELGVTANDGSGVFTGRPQFADGYWWGRNYISGQLGNGTIRCPLDVVKIDNNPKAGDNTKYYRFQFNAGGIPITDAGMLTATAACRNSGVQYSIVEGYNGVPGKLVNGAGAGNNKAGEEVNPDGAPAPEGEEGAPGAGEQKVCESEGGKLAFLLCFIVDQLFNVFGTLQEQAVKYLHFTLIAPDDKFGLPAAQYASAKASWLFISRLANAILAVAFLMMIIGTAMTEFLDAYSVKKILPRLVIAIILVNTSWYICTFLLEVGNVLGAGIREIILSPFGSAQQTPLINLAIPGGGYTDLLAGAGGLVALFVPGLGGFILLTLFSVLVPAVLTILLGFVLIIARQGMLLLLTVISPLAFALWVLPGTESLFGRWRKLFATLVLFYPIFQAILAIGVVIAIITTAKG